MVARACTVKPEPKSLWPTPRPSTPATEHGPGSSPAKGPLRCSRTALIVRGHALLSWRPGPAPHSPAVWAGGHSAAPHQHALTMPEAPRPPTTKGSG